mmetsp:Transcript_30713/g.77655  ORF Transcript_30713/g.77655 Transcript_30713/m.77655 type:complete len:246 (-) Transcript_30713:1189-1926(-)
MGLRWLVHHADAADAAAAGIALGHDPEDLQGLLGAPVLRTPFVVLAAAWRLCTLAARRAVQVQKHIHARGLEVVHSLVQLVQAWANIGLARSRAHHAPGPEGQPNVRETRSFHLSEVFFGEVGLPVLAQSAGRLVWAQGSTSAPLTMLLLRLWWQLLPEVCAWARLQQKPTTQVNAAPLVHAPEGALEVALRADERLLRIRAVVFGLVRDMPGHVPDHPRQVSAEAFLQGLRVLDALEVFQELVL